jgi:hypothetical protein
MGDGAAQRGRPRIHASASARRAAWRAENGLRKITVDVPEHFAKGFIELAKHSRSARPRRMTSNTEWGLSAVFRRPGSVPDQGAGWIRLYENLTDDEQIEIWSWLYRQNRSA